VAAPHVSDKTWRELPPIVRQRMTAAGLSEILTQINDAAAGGGFVADDAHLSRTQLVLDEKGRDALNKELAATLARVDRIQEQARKRLGNDHASEDRMTLVMLRFDNVAVPKEEIPRTRRRTRSGQRRRTAAR